MKQPLKVRDYMVTKVLTVTPEFEITRVVDLLIENDISGLVVLDKEGATVGIVTERDCIATVVHSGYFDELGGPVSEYMSSPVETAAPTDSLVEVADRFVNSAFRRFPVIENGRLVGIIARRDVLRALVRFR